MTTTPTAWPDALDAYARHLETTNRTPHTRSIYLGVLRQIAAHLPDVAPWNVATSDLLAWLRSESIAPRTWTNRRAVARDFYRWAITAGHVTSSPAADLPTARTCRTTAADHPSPQAARTPHGPARTPLPERWAPALADYDLFQRAAGRSETTRRLHRAHLSRFAREHADQAPGDLGTLDLVHWLGTQDLSAESRRSVRSTLRAFYRWAVLAGHTDTSPAEAMPTVPEPYALPRPIPDDALAEALASSDERTALILHLAAGAGLRRAEIARVHSRDLLDTGAGWALRIMGKGAKERLVPLAPPLTDALRALPRGWAFPASRGAGHLTPERVATLAQAVLPGPYTLHTLRHRFATTAYRVSHDLLAVQQLLGHSNPNTTRRYVGLDADALRAVVTAVAAVPLPVAA